MVLVNLLWGITILSVLGHCYSIYLGLEGGKGVANGPWSLYSLFQFLLLIGAAVWMDLCKSSLKSSLSSLLGLVAVVISAVF